MADRDRTPQDMSDQLRYVLQMVSDGRMEVREARKRLRGIPVPTGPASLIKEGRWASEGGYPSGPRGARAAARDALAEERAS